MPAMTALDIIVLLIVGGSGVMGFMRGFTTEILSVLAWALAILALKLFHAPVSEILTGLTGTKGGAMVLGFALVFGLVFFGGKMIARSIGKQTKQSVLGSFDRVLGVGFGALKGLLIATIGYTAITMVYDTIYGGDTKRPVWMTESRSYALLDASSRAMLNYLDKRRKGENADPSNQGADEPAENAITGA